MTFFKIFPNCLKRQKKLFDSHPTVAWPPTTVARPFSNFFSKKFRIAWNVKKSCLTVIQRSRDLRPLSRDLQWLFFKKISNCLKLLRNVVWQSSNGRLTSDHCRVTFSGIFLNLSESLETSKNVVWQSSDGRVTSDHCRVTVQRLFSKIFRIAWNVEKTLFDSRLTVAWPLTTVAWPFSDFF